MHGKQAVSKYYQNKHVPCQILFLFVSNAFRVHLEHTDLPVYLWENIFPIKGSLKRCPCAHIAIIYPVSL